MASGECRWFSCVMKPANNLGARSCNSSQANRCGMCTRVRAIASRGSLGSLNTVQQPWNIAILCFRDRVFLLPHLATALLAYAISGPRMRAIYVFLTFFSFIFPPSSPVLFPNSFLIRIVKRSAVGYNTRILGGIDEHSDSVTDVTGFDRCK